MTRRIRRERSLYSRWVWIPLQPNSATLFTLLVLFAIGILAPDRLNNMEAEVMWITQDEATVIGAAPGDALRGLGANLSDMVGRLGAQPSLYTIVLDFWRTLTGGSIMAAQLFSTFCALLGVAVFRRLLPGPPLLLAPALIAAFAATQVQSYALLFLLCLLATWTLLVWLRTDSRRMVALYSVLVLLATAVHPAALLLLPLHALVASGQLRLALPVTGAFLLLYWLAIIVPGNTPTFGALGTVGIAATAPLWPVLWRPFLLRQVAGLLLLLATVGLIITKPEWSNAVASLNFNRLPGEPTLTYIPPRHPLAYYETRPGTQIQREITVNLGWRDHTRAELDTILDNLNDPQAVWVIMPVDNSEAEYIREQLTAEGYVLGFEYDPGGDIPFQRYEKL